MLLLLLCFRLWLSRLCVMVWLLLLLLLLLLWHAICAGGVVLLLRLASARLAATGWFASGARSHRRGHHGRWRQGGWYKRACHRGHRCSSWDQHRDGESCAVSCLFRLPVFLLLLRQLSDMLGTLARAGQPSLFLLMGELAFDGRPPLQPLFPLDKVLAVQLVELLLLQLPCPLPPVVSVALFDCQVVPAQSSVVQTLYSAAAALFLLLLLHHSKLALPVVNPLHLCFVLLLLLVGQLSSGSEHAEPQVLRVVVGARPCFLLLLLSVPSSVPLGSPILPQVLDLALGNHRLQERGVVGPELAADLRWLLQQQPWLGNLHFLLLVAALESGHSDNSTHRTPFDRVGRAQDTDSGDVGL
mmetsp:Transcript_45684/g.89949  ORF Transcript_45684/g.89949 Transcript_45684/m.89949 type:complete len:357 (-) Transcript_45684:1024-2094(-)